MKKIRFIFLGTILAFLVLGFSACKENYDASALAETEFDYEAGKAPDTERIASLKKEILSKRAELERPLAAAGSLGRLYRALALEYQNFGMYDLSLGAWEKALEIEMTNPIVYYRAGLMAAQVAKLLPDSYDAMLKKAEAYYREALRLKPDYTEVMYALSVLLYFEKKEFNEANQLINEALNKEADNSQYMFLAARIAADLGNTDRALYWYDKIQASKASDEDKKQARMNQEVLRRSN